MRLECVQRLVGIDRVRQASKQADQERPEKKREGKKKGKRTQNVSKIAMNESILFAQKAHIRSYFYRHKTQNKAASERASSNKTT